MLLLAATLFAVSAITGGETTQGMWVMCAYFLLPVIGLGKQPCYRETIPLPRNSARGGQAHRDAINWSGIIRRSSGLVFLVAHVLVK